MAEVASSVLRRVPVLTWGVVAPGMIAEHWARAVRAHTDQRIGAVASRDPVRARRFAARHSIPRVHGSYQELFDDPGIDVVYVATPHHLHVPIGMQALAAGKHVPIEKPLALSAAEAEHLAEASRAAGRFAMEAMWTRFLPQSRMIDVLLADLGPVRLVQADFGGIADPDPSSRAWDPALGGGALLDLGVYPVAFAHALLGSPSSVRAFGTLGPTGVDAQAALVLDHPSGAQALLSASQLAETPRRAAISAEFGRIELDPPFYAPTALTVTRGGVTERWTGGDGITESGGLAYQVVEAASCIAAGLRESPIHPLGAAIAALRVLDEAREQLEGRAA